MVSCGYRRACNIKAIEIGAIKELANNASLAYIYYHGNSMALKQDLRG